MEICRDTYVDRLMHFRHNGTVKVITGVRRCGKSYLLLTMFRRALEEHGVPLDHIVAVDLESEGNERFWDPTVLGDYLRSQIKDDGKYYILLDEIQRVGKTLPPGVDLERIATEDRESAYVTFYDVLNGLNNRKNSAQTQGRRPLANHNEYACLGCRLACKPQADCGYTSFNAGEVRPDRSHGEEISRLS